MFNEYCSCVHGCYLLIWKKQIYETLWVILLKYQNKKYNLFQLNNFSLRYRNTETLPLNTFLTPSTKVILAIQEYAP
jgi:hypothetical protein